MFIVYKLNVYDMDTPNAWLYAQLPSAMTVGKTIFNPLHEGTRVPESLEWKPNHVERMAQANQEELSLAEWDAKYPGHRIWDLYSNGHFTSFQITEEVVYEGPVISF